MKICFRIGPDQGREQNGPQPPARYSSAHTAVRFLDPFTVLALIGEGSTCEGSRFNGARRLRALPLAPIPLLPRQHRAKSSTKLGESEQLSDKSNRNWPKYRSYRKQTIKPCLTGARTAQCRARFSTAKLQSRDRHPLSISHLLALTQGAPLAAVVSNREFLVLEIPQLIENKHRRPVLIENFEPNSAPSFRPFATAAFLPRGAKASRAASSLTEIPRNHFTAHGAV